MKFTCIGFDVKQWPWKNGLSIDESEWNKDEINYYKLIEKFNLKENEYQLLEINNQEQLQEIIFYIEKEEYSNLVAVNFPLKVVEIHDTKYGYNTGSINLKISDFTFRGFDICDFNGLFSVLNHPDLNFSSESGLISKDELSKALEIMQIANVLEPSHSPFIVTEIYTLK